MYEIFAKLLQEKHITTYRVAKETGIPQSTFSAWKSGEYSPKIDKLQRIADYLGVTVNYLTGDDTMPTQQQKPSLTPKDERDIARDLERFIAEMDQNGDLMFDGDPMCPEARESIIAAMKLGLQAAKMKNKERFTPKKYRKGTKED